MTTLDDLQGTAVSMDDLREATPEPVRTTPLSDQNKAAHVAMLGGDDVIMDYERSMAGMAEGDSSYADDVLNTSRQESASAAQEALITTVGNTQLDQGQKEHAVAAYYFQNQAEADFKALLKEEMIVSPSEGESDYQSKVRLTHAGRMAEEARYQEEASKMALSEAAKANPELVDSVWDLFSLWMVPLAETTLVNDIQTKLEEKEIGKAEAVTSVWENIVSGKGALSGNTWQMGNAKANLVSILDSVPPDDRIDLARALVDIISDETEVMLSGDNEFAAYNMLRDVVDRGYIDDFQQNLDNLATLLDVVPFVSGAIGAAGRGLRNLEANFFRGMFAGNEVKGAVKPNSVMATMGNSNPTRYRRAMLAIESDATGETARALTGTTRQAAIVDDVAPDVGTEVGRQLLPTREFRFVGLPAPETVIPMPAPAGRDFAFVGLPSPDKVSKVEDANAAAKASTKEPGLAPGYGVRVQARDIAIPPNAKGAKETVLRPAPIRPKVPPLRDVEELAINGNQAMVARANTSGGIHYTIREKDEAAARITNKFRDLTDIRLVSNASTVGTRMGSDKVHLTGVYARKDGGWLTARDATESFMFAARSNGIREQDFDVLIKGPEGYVPIDPSMKMDDTVKGDFMVALDYQYKIRPSDVDKWAHFDVTWNWLDIAAPELSQSGARLTRNIFDPASLFDPHIVQSALVAVDRAAGIQADFMKMAEEFTTRFSKANPIQKEKITEYIHRANRDGLTFNQNQLEAEGFDRNSIEAIEKFRQYWDTDYLFENEDLIKNLDAEGYMVLTDYERGHRLFAKPIPRSLADVRAYDTLTDKVVRLNKEELDALYEAEGTVARLRASIEDNDELIEYVISHNTKSDYFRKLSNHDAVLSYRPSHYRVIYKNPVFIDKNIYNEEGVLLKTKTVAVAKDHKTAERFTAGMAKEEGSSVETYRIRTDKNSFRVGSQEHWDLNQTKGRIATRFRGERLEDADANANMNILDAHIEDPATAMQKSMRSLSERIATRDWLESMKHRFIDQFGKYLPVRDGQPFFPQRWEEVSAPGLEGTKELGDARTLFEYINYMQNGYTNSIDEGMSALVRRMASAVGRKTEVPFTDFAERAMHQLGELKPTGILKNSSFHAYLALNPQRQIVIQAHQAVQLQAIAPKFFYTTLWRQMGAVTLYRSLYEPFKNGGKSPKLMKEAMQKIEDIGGVSFQATEALAGIVERSGLWHAVDKTNLLQGDLTYLADSLTGSGNSAMRIAGKMTSAVRKAGFDAGEQMNLLSSFLTHLHLEQKALAKAGQSAKSMDQEVIDIAYGKARNFTYGMNKAGDMPYNQNSFGSIMQYQQVPHKYATTLLTNRGISKQQRRNLWVFNALAYGVPTAFTGYILDTFLDSIGQKDNEELRTVIGDGLEAYALNKSLQAFDEEGEYSEVDWSGFAPGDAYASLSFLDSLLTDGSYNIIANSPGGQLFFGNNPRFTNAFRRSLGLIVDMSQGNMETEDILQTMDAWASISSGYSNYMRGQMAREYGILYNSSQTYIMDQDVTKMEGYMVKLGFNTKDSMQDFKTKRELWEVRQDLERDAKETYRLLKMQLRDEGVMVHQGDDFVQGMLTIVQRSLSFEERNMYMGEIFKLMRKDADAGEGVVWLALLEVSEIMGEDEFRKLINSTQLSPEDKRQLRTVFDKPKYEEDDD